MAVLVEDSRANFQLAPPAVYYVVFIMCIILLCFPDVLKILWLDGVKISLLEIQKRFVITSAPNGADDRPWMC